MAIQTQSLTIKSFIFESDQPSQRAPLDIKDSEYGISELKLSDCIFNRLTIHLFSAEGDIENCIFTNSKLTRDLTSYKVIYVSSSTFNFTFVSGDAIQVDRSSFWNSTLSSNSNHVSHSSFWGSYQNENRESYPQIIVSGQAANMPSGTTVYLSNFTYALNGVIQSIYNPPLSYDVPIAISSCLFKYNRGDPGTNIVRIVDNVHIEITNCLFEENDVPFTTGSVIYIDSNLDQEVFVSFENITISQEDIETDQYSRVKIEKRPLTYLEVCTLNVRRTLK